ncbi:MAG TPA: hypothetical protein VM096_17145 [Vicinamibacterales bacterium]|nr:hypothetical protein [Vicinamibacterales bacterium]
MKTRIALLVVLAVAGSVWYMRGAPNPLTSRTLGGAAAAVETPYKSEQAWAVREIAADISEMARNGKGDAAAFTEAIAPWHPELFETYAAEQLGTRGPSGSDESDPAGQHEDLLAMSVDAIIESSNAASSALMRDMKNPGAHEAAALTVAAFALRESAEGLSDTRWALNRITAHLAMAQALRDGEPPSVDGQLAAAALFALTDRHKTALATLDAVPASTPAAAAWQRALRMRVTQDWKMLSEPAIATRLEKLEYFRARRATLRRTRAGQDLEDLGEPIAADFARIAAGRSLGVDDGNDFIYEGLINEVTEMKHVYWQVHKRQLSKMIPADIANERAGRLLAHGDPQVIPWGAWAEFGNRHVGMWAMKTDYHLRHMQGSPQEADDTKRSLDIQYGDWTMYPVASMGRTKGQRGTEADLSQIDKAIAVAIRAPELVSFDYWSFIENGSNYEPVQRGMPKRKTWFISGSADVPYDIGHRAEFMIGALKPVDVEALMDETRHNDMLLSRVAQRYRSNEDLTAKVRELAGARVAYDMWAIESAVNAARDADDRIALQRQACELAVGQCLELASELAANDEAAGAAEYEKAFSNPALDAVTMTYSSRWLVQYYERTNQSAKATALAKRSAAVGSSRGMQTLALLYEQRGQLAEADRAFSAVAERYPDCCTPILAAFLYRQAVVAKNPDYLARWKAIEHETFSNGLQPMAVDVKGRPANGVFVEKDSYWSRKAGLQAGDIIIGVDGFKVENVDQLDTVMWFKPQAKTYQLTAWRGVLITSEIPTNHRMTLKTHPLKGWIE